MSLPHNQKNASCEEQGRDIECHRRRTFSAVVVRESSGAASSESADSIAVLRYADATGSALLKSCCLRLAVHNLALVLQESHASLVNVPDEQLFELEQFCQEKVLLMNASANGDRWRDEEQSAGNRISSATRRPARCTLTRSVSSAPVESCILL